MPGCWISVGSNLDRENSVRGGVQDLQQRFGELAISPIYESQAIGCDGPPFLNLVVGIRTPLAVSAINALLRAIEDAHGRVRGGDKFAPRTLDLDLLTYGEMVGTIDGYRLPRGELLDYAFVLAPLAVVAPDERHPELGVSYRRLWADFDLAARGQPPPRRIPFALDLDAVVTKS